MDLFYRKWELIKVFTWRSDIIIAALQGNYVSSDIFNRFKRKTLRWLISKSPNE